MCSISQGKDKYLFLLSPGEREECRVKGWVEEPYLIWKYPPHSTWAIPNGSWWDGVMEVKWRFNLRSNILKWLRSWLYGPRGIFWRRTTWQSIAVICDPNLQINKIWLWLNSLPLSDFRDLKNANPKWLAKRIQSHGLSYEQYEKTWHSWIDLLGQFYVTQDKNAWILHVNSITCPTLIIAGDKDPLVTISQAQRLHEHIKTSRFQLIDRPYFVQWYF